MRREEGEEVETRGSARANSWARRCGRGRGRGRIVAK